MGDIDQFAQTLTKVQHHNPTVVPHLPQWFHMARGPIVGWFIAHNGFQGGAMTTAGRQGIVCSDSLDIAHALCMSRRFGITESLATVTGGWRQLVEDELTATDAATADAI